MTDESIFAAALAIPDPADRATYLDRACGGNAALRAEVEGLLAAHAADNPLDRRPADLARTGAYEPDGDDPPPAAVGDRIGPYRLMEQIGEGGFGLVFVAEQQEPVRRKVALKVIKPGMDTRDVVARFEAERQPLALMDHPNIARVLDAGSTPQGRPYFVMELVRGVPITDYCDQQRLPPRDRLPLFVQVCQAVQHAHQKGVIHRDLKPSNVLVAPHDGVPVVKVIDFGVAKAVGQRLTEKTVYTRLAQMVGTPLYMSPEQAEVNQLDVDTRSDVYSLGVLLYELLTGTTPFDRDRFRKAAYDEIRRIIREEDPPRPSTRLTSLGATLTAVSASRGTDPGKLAGVVRGELDWIVMRCLEKDRTRRYESAAGLARDVQRYLAGDAVEACPPTLGYRLRKAFRRHKAAAAVASGFLGLLLAGTGLTAWQAVRATGAESEAARQRDEAVASKNDALAAHRAAEAERDNVARANESLRRLAADQRRALYATSMNLAQAAWEGGNPARTFELLRQWTPGRGEDDLRGFEWHYWNRFAHLDLRSVRLPASGGPEVERSPATLSPDGTRVAAFVSDPDGRTDRLTLWDAPTGREVWGVAVPHSRSPAGFTTFSPDGRLFAASRATLRRGDNRRTHSLDVWDTTKGKSVFTRAAPEDAFGRPALSADGSLLAFPSLRRGTNFAGQVTVVRLSDGKEVFRYPTDQSRVVPFAVSISPDSRRLAAVVATRAESTPDTLRVWELEGGREVWKASLPAAFVAMDVGFSPDGSRVVARAGDERNDWVLSWDAAAGEKLPTLKLPTPPGRKFFQPHVAFGPGGRRLAVPQGPQVYLFDLDPGQPPGADPVPRAVRGHEHAVAGVAFGRGGSELVTLDAGGVVKYWDPAAREPRLKTPFGWGIRTGAVLPNADGSRVAFVPADSFAGGEFRMTDGSGRVVFRSPLPGGHGDDAAFSADGRTFALVWHDGYQFTVFVWDSVRGQELLRLAPPPGGGGTVSLAPDGSRVAVATSSYPNEGGGSLSAYHVWETATGQEVLARRDLRTEAAFYAAHSPDGRWLVVNPGLSAGGDVRLVWLDARTGGEAAALKLGPRAVTGVAFSRDGRRVAVAHRAGEAATVRVWEVEPILRGEAPEPAVTLTGLGGESPRVAFSPDGRRVLTSGDGTVRLWDAGSGREVLTLRASGAPTGDAYFSPDGHTIWGGLDENGRLWGWDGTPVGEARSP